MNDYKITESGFAYGYTGENIREAADKWLHATFQRGCYRSAINTRSGFFTVYAPNGKTLVSAYIRLEK